MTFFKETKSPPITISYPKTVNSNDIKENGLLLSDSEIKKALEVLCDQPDKRFSKLELKKLGLDFNYSIIKDNHRYFIVYKKNVYLGKGSEGRVKLAQYIGDDTELKNEPSKSSQWSIGKLLAMKVTYANSAINSKLNEEQQILELLGRAHTKVIAREKNGVVKYQYLQELIPGESLKMYVDHHPDGISLKTAINILFNTLTQMQFLHAKGILHRDIKTGNVIYDEKNECIQFVDFGLAAKMNKDRQVYSYNSMGTEGYMAPEIISPGYFRFLRYYNEKTEIFALGILFKDVFNIIKYISTGSDLICYQDLNKLIQTMTDKVSEKRPDADAIYHFFEKLPVELQPNNLVSTEDKQLIVRFLNAIDSDHKGWVFGNPEKNQSTQIIWYSTQQDIHKTNRILWEEIIEKGKKAGLTDEVILELQKEINHSNASKTTIKLEQPHLLLQLRDVAKKYEEALAKEFAYYLKKR